jgi:hypothetical protein
MLLLLEERSPSLYPKPADLERKNMEGELGIPHVCPLTDHVLSVTGTQFYHADNDVEEEGPLVHSGGECDRGVIVYSKRTNKFSCCTCDGSRCAHWRYINYLGEEGIVPNPEDRAPSGGPEQSEWAKFSRTKINFENPTQVYFPFVDVVVVEVVVVVVVGDASVVGW